MHQTCSCNFDSAVFSHIPLLKRVHYVTQCSGDYVFPVVSCFRVLPFVWNSLVGWERERGRSGCAFTQGSRGIFAVCKGWFSIFYISMINDFVSDISSINNFSPPLNCLMIAHYITIDSIRVYDNKSHFSFGLKLGSKKINRNRPWFHFP